MNDITSPELLAQVNPDNIALLSDFLDYLKSLQRSELTIRGYESDINIAWVWNLKHNDNLPYVDWTKRQVVKYQNWLLNENNNSPARIKRLKSSLSSLSNYIESVLDDEYPDYRNIIKKVESPVNQPVREKTIFTNEQISILLSQLTENGCYDKACAVALALYSGRRKAELVRFRVSDFTPDNLVSDGALYKTGKIKTKGRGQQGKMLECFCLAKQFDPYLNNWLEYRKQNGIESEWLLPDPNNLDEQMKVTRLNSWAKTFTKMLGVDFYWHALRHMTVTMFARAGIPDTVIQQYLGWSDINMVSLYTDLQADEKMEMYFSADGVKTPEKKSLTELGINDE